MSQKVKRAAIREGSIIGDNKEVHVIFVWNIFIFSYFGTDGDVVNVISKICNVDATYRTYSWQTE